MTTLEWLAEQDRICAAASPPPWTPEIVGGAQDGGTLPAEELGPDWAFVVDARLALPKALRIIREYQSLSGLEEQYRRGDIEGIGTALKAIWRAKQEAERIINE